MKQDWYIIPLMVAVIIAIIVWAGIQLYGADHFIKVVASFF